MEPEAPHTPKRATTAQSLLNMMIPGVQTTHKRDSLSPPSKSLTPKRNLSAYMWFTQDHQRAMVEANPGLSIGHVEKMLEGNWKTLSAQTKQSYEDKAVADEARYEEESRLYTSVKAPSSPKGMGSPKPPDSRPARGLDVTQQEEGHIEFSTPGRRKGLRAKKPNMSLKAMENGERSTSKTSTRNVVSNLSALNLMPKVSERAAIREEIASKTAVFRDRFLVDKKDLWLPLLPEKNYIQKLVDKESALSPEEAAQRVTTTPYEEIDAQPQGVTAVMKPYQLSGLSFMMWLHRNGLSGILGDEMGLGKTLQTLSLIQYLKENDPKAGTGTLQRPFLVVCPLSVLSSWMTEAAKWTPGLKVVRFHGPVKERDRLKKLVVGEIDIYGHPTAQAKYKKKAHLTAHGKPMISLDTDSEDEDDVGVDLVVTTYDSFKCEQSWFKRAFVWRYVVLDEGHTVKNHESQISKSLQGLNAEYRLILTGTPLQNDLSELWSLLHYLYPEVFHEKTSELFDKSFNLSKGNYSGTVIDSARRLLELIMLRRMKNSPGVDLNLPPKTEVLLFVPLSPMQRFWYERMITKADQGLLHEIFGGTRKKEEDALKHSKEDDIRETQLMEVELDALPADIAGSEAWQASRLILQETVQREQESKGNVTKRSDWQKLMNLIMQLRKISNHPYQILNAEPDPYYTGHHIVEASGKFIVLEKLVRELVVKQKKKILIFSGFTNMLDLVEELLELNGGDGTDFNFARIDGSTCRARRTLSIKMLNDLESNYRVMLISTRAGGLGINLASASDVILLDQDWNPQITLQAEARAHRIGQKNPVTIYKLVSQGTVEEQMMGRIQKKLYLSAKVTEAMQDIHTKFGKADFKGKKTSKSDDDMPQMDVNQLMTLIRRGASAISKPQIDVDEMLAWDWETTVAKCKDQPADLNIKKDVVPGAGVDTEAEQKWLSEVEKVESKIFEGKMLAKKKGNSTKDIASEFYAERADRRVGKNTTVMIDGYAVSKDTVNNGQWVAVQTISSTTRAFAEPKREKKAAVEPQSHCQVCMDGGKLTCCHLCPRAYHVDCLDKDFRSKAKGWQFNCPQHQCYDCNSKTGDAGGMLYRCRWCERAYCEDCMAWDKFMPFGDTLPEYEVLGYPEQSQAFYIQCGYCTDHLHEHPEDRTRIDEFAEESLIALERMKDAEKAEIDGLTDATTATGVNTPVTPMDSDYESKLNDNKKRKAVSEPSKSRVAKKERTYYEIDD